MYKFTLTDKFRQRGVSPDAISPEMRNQFDAIFSESGSTLDRKIQVRLDEKVIRFFYYLEDVNEDVLIEKNYKEIASISLTNVKETGYDILHFRKQVIGKCPEKKLPDIDSTILNNLVGHPKSNEENLLLYNFPFVDGWNFDDQTSEPISKEQFAFLMQCCFLYFILDMENRESDLAQSPLYEDVRGKLRQSDVYLLLSAKTKYIIRLYKDASPLSQDDYSFVTQKFADRLMDSRINKVIAPYDYPDKESYFVRKLKTWGIRLFTKKAKTSTQLWFYDPEDELEAILEKNRKQDHETNSEKEAIFLEESLELKIRDFLYTKHAVGQAMTRTISKRLLLCAQILMGITSLVIISSSIFLKSLSNTIPHKIFPSATLLFCLIIGIFFLYLDKKKERGQRCCFKQLWIYIPLIILAFCSVFTLLPKNHNVFRHLFYMAAVACSIIWTAISGHYNNPGENKKANGVIYAFFPRILVAEMAAWLTIGIAEDLVKSMLWVDNVRIILSATALVLFLVFVILYGEIKQHSPYKLLRETACKRVLPILNHAVFFALIIGLLVQTLFYNNLIKNSDVMVSVVFNDYFADADHYCQNLIDLDNTVKRYQDYCFSSSLQNIEMYGSVKRSQKFLLNDSTVLTTTMIVNQKTSNPSKEKIDNYNAIVEHYNDIVNNLNDFYKNRVDEKTWINDTLRVLYDTVDSINDRIKKNNEDKLNKSPEVVDLKKEISCIRRNMLKFNNYDTLMSWAAITHPEESNTGSECLDTLTVKAIRKYNCCLNIGKKRIFPTLLIFHTLIVLVLAFVTQLLISDKTVTEPL